jgi:cyclopropane-fatty-acyl-phospholipid synthase
VVAARGPPIYRRYAGADEAARVGSHYERPVEFFYPVLGGAWHLYSGLLWEHATSVTEAQEEKLDFLAALMRLQRGQRILDVGCGWGGPLVYLCNRYGVSGVGLTVAEGQYRGGAERIAGSGVEASVVLCHWREYEPDGSFDVVYADEATGHFSDLAGYFAKVYTMLRVGGLMMIRDLHFTHPRHAEMSRAMVFINELFGETANYRTLAEELGLANEAGFDLVKIRQIDISHYLRTLDAWQQNLRDHRKSLEGLVGREDVRRFEAYLRVSKRALRSRTMTVEVTLFEKRT